MDVRFFTVDGLTTHRVDEIRSLLGRPDGLLWVDIPEWSAAAGELLTDMFGFHPLAVADAEQRNQVPKVHVYPGHVFLVLHAPEPGAGGHVHFVEIDQFIGDRFLVTLHGPLNPAVAPESATVEVRALEGRLRSGKLRPSHGFELSHAIASALTGRMRLYMTELTREVWSLEQRVTGDELQDPERFLDELFRTRHGLLTVRTMCALTKEVYGRMLTIEAFGTGRGKKSVRDAIDQFFHLQLMADSQKEYLQGTIEFYKARTDTKMTIAAERLAVIAAITLPITALSSVLGMNLIVNDHTHWFALWVTLAIMAVMSLAILVWAKRKGWF